MMDKPATQTKKHKTKTEAMKQWHTREQSSQVSEIINVSFR